jgi:tRNA pseudouridine13 synthase
LYLSVARAFLFNEVLAGRVRDGSWAQQLCGDVLEAEGPTGPLWGRGRSPTSGRAAELEALALEPYAALREGLEHAGLAQERRPLRLQARALRWQEHGDVLELAFELPPGAYATAFLAEVFELEEPTL